ncbi:outer membrane beta-barrel protein [Epilithonimonas mollis]|uniref:Outer membrane protein beta-barrel domain-containing protein n=1 Tax=Epilithonimonas mollis TaxID=216903 RepID=A0A1M6TCI5_9FLAO|nr:outer membrane beta-barrel protein [Epilithonimonas mollis]SHK54681.1 Outer membrane protein beta-barrel domain-containing protein [Epilithonimonas mollis]
MKTLYKTTVAIFCLCLFSKATAQRLDILGGINMTGITHETSQQKTDQSGNVGYHVGMAVFVAFNPEKYKKDDDREGYGLLPTLQFVKKGSSKNSVINNSAADIKLGFLQLNLPLIYTASNMDIGLGPYVAYALSGSKKYRVGNGEKEKIDFGNELGRMDYGLGIQFTLFMFKFQYDYGLANLAKGNDNKANTRSFSLSVNIPLVQ